MPSGEQNPPDGSLTGDYSKQVLVYRKIHFLRWAWKTGGGYRFQTLLFGLITAARRLTDRPSMACRQLRTSCPHPSGPDVVPRRASARRLPAMPPASLVTERCGLHCLHKKNGKGKEKSIKIRKNRKKNEKKENCLQKFEKKNSLPYNFLNIPRLLSEKSERKGN